LSNKGCKLPSDPQLRHELVAPRYNFTSSGKIIVESKDSMRKRGMRSPDLADALCLTFASNAGLVGGRSSSWIKGKPLKRKIAGIV
jgi:phage terminase large subunit